MTTPTTAAVPAQPDAPAFTDAQIASACMSYRHDFGLLEPDERAQAERLTTKGATHGN